MRSGWVLIFAILFIVSCKSIKPIQLSSTEINIQNNFNNYSFSDINQTPIQTIRINIHVFQDSLGKGNFTPYDSLGNNAVDWYWLRGLVDDASKKMTTLLPMNMPTTSSFIKDSRIRYEVIGVYDWKDQEIFELRNIGYSTGQKMYQFIMNKEEVLNKENSLHLFIAGGINKDNGRIASRGIASGAPDKKWTVLFNYYQQAKTVKNYWPATLISHEIGHNLGLRHTWNLNDGCDDTPQNKYHLERNPSGFQCWNMNSPSGSKCDEQEEVSNNLMDYNASQNAITACQLAKIHFNIKNNRGNLQDIISANPNEIIECKEISGLERWSGNSSYSIDCAAGYPMRWFVSPRIAVKNPIGSGNNVLLESTGFSGKAIITFQVLSANGVAMESSKNFRIQKSLN